MKLTPVARAALYMMLGEEDLKTAMSLVNKLPVRAKPTRRIYRIAAVLDPFPSQRYATQFFTQYERYVSDCEQARLDRGEA